MSKILQTENLDLSIISSLVFRLGEANLSYLMKIALESPEILSDEELEQIMNVWTRKSRRIAV